MFTNESISYLLQVVCGDGFSVGLEALKCIRGEWISAFMMTSPRILVPLYPSLLA